VLVDGLAQLDYGPSIVPTIEQMSFPLCPQLFDSVTWSTDEAPSRSCDSCILVPESL
jgi:hypothetical protein